jgi:hypothetical protein
MMAKQKRPKCMSVRLFVRVQLLAVWFAVLGGPLAFAQTCPTGDPSIDNAKGHKLFLYFPTIADATFPSWRSDVSPAQPFDVADLSRSIGTTAQLMDEIKAVVADDYCDFNVQVIATTTNPGTLPSPPPLRTTVAIGSDGKLMTKGDWGCATTDATAQGCMVNTGAANPINFARVWAGFYTVCEGGGGPNVLGPPTVFNNGNPYVCSTAGALTGPNDTLEHWVQAIGGTAAHEAGHTYGLAHTDENPNNDPCTRFANGPPSNPNEDPFNRHLMPAGCNLTGLDRVFRRHFGNRAYGILATNVGLSISMMHSWDLVNPNAESASSLTIDFLSPLSSISIVGPYAGPQSPWLNPVVSGPSGTATFKGVTYNKFRITWSAANPAWTNPLPGVVAGGATFHIGTSFTGVDFNQPDPIIIENVTLLDASSQPLALSPLLPSYDAGTADRRNNQFVLQFFAPASAPRLRMVSATVLQLPQLGAIDALVGEGRAFVRSGLPIKPWASTNCNGGPLRMGVRCVIARLNQKPHVFVKYQVGQRNVFACQQGMPRDLPAAAQLPNSPTGLIDHEVRICAGIQRDPFPSAVVYVLATFVEPKAKHYDAAKNAYVVGPIISKVYYQFAGIRRLPGTR